jgi:hypothetical protein
MFAMEQVRENIAIHNVSHVMEKEQLEMNVMREMFQNMMMMMTIKNKKL